MASHYCVSNSAASSTPAVIVPMNSALLKLPLQSYIQFWALHQKKDIEELEYVQSRAMELMKGLERKSCGEQLSELRFFHLE
ncbi:hypothetical protein DUI87_08190 [Hirundo rustica rustica]|uniref:Uncharacterized protein n=1 Tax=Hirundo rustica rustica TaxID=333673 RepID=A0A3M0KS49_HIRRU|nr:hypothetical protein DUI87_08190 [Hirundo rustica rustica]